MNIDCMPLFPSNLFKSHIDPLSYDKTKIIDTVLRNYELQKERNEWDETSKLHHYYGDWENEAFEKIDISSVMEQYKDIYKNILDSMFIEPISFNVSFENITVHKGGNTNMAVHNHINDHVFLSGVHYIKSNETSSKITFVNPLVYSEYPNLSINNITKKSMNSSNETASAYFREWNVPPTEDTMLIFPAYLNHKVDASGLPDSDFRIAIVTNLQIFKS